MSRLFTDIRPLKESRDFRLLFSGQLVSLLGSQLTIVAVAYQVYLATRSNLWVGYVSLAQLPMIVGGALWGGAISDRVDKRLQLSVCAFALSLFSVGLALNAQIAGHRTYVIILLAAFAALLTGIANPARSAAIPALVRPDQLLSAYSINQTVIQLSSVIGPGFAGILIGFVSIASCYWVDAATYIVLAFATLAMRPLRTVAPRLQTVRRAILDGFVHVRENRVAQFVYLIDLNAMVFGMPTALFPAIALTWYHGGPRTLGLLNAAPAIGALVGALTTGWVTRIAHLSRTIVLAVAAWGIAIVCFGLSPWCWLGVTFLALAGWADVISAVVRNTILQQSTTDEFRGRVSSIQMAVVQGGPRLGNFEAGAVAAATTGGFSVISGGVLSALGALAFLIWRPAIWKLRSPS